MIENVGDCKNGRKPLLDCVMWFLDQEVTGSIPSRLLVRCYNQFGEGTEIPILSESTIGSNIQTIIIEHYFCMRVN